MKNVAVLTAGRVIWQLKSPHPQEFAIQGKKKANALGSAGGGGGWAQLELTDVWICMENYASVTEWQKLFFSSKCF